MKWRKDNKKSMNTTYMSAEGIKSFIEITSTMNIKRVSLAVTKLTCKEIAVFPFWINGSSASIDHPIGNIKYNLKIWRRAQARVLTASHIFYLRDLNGKPTEITLEIQVSSEPIFDDRYDKDFFEIAFEYAKAVLASTHFPKCGKIEFNLPSSYYELEEFSKTHFDGYEDFRGNNKKASV